MAETAAAFKLRISAIAGPNVFRKSALNIRDGAGVLERVLGTGRYRRVLEIGTFKGATAAFMAQFCEHIDTIDLEYGRLEQLGETFDHRAFWDAAGSDNIELHLVRGAVEKAALIAELNFDLAFIDGGKNDVARDFASVKHCGAVLFHDYASRGQRSLDAVYNFVNGLPQEQVKIMDIFALWRAGGY